jgi:hypothetical protein
MAGSRNLGTGTANRLAQRLDRSQLQRVTVPGGGEAFTGPVASRALDALGARAMTLDRSVIVSEDFDPSKAEDKALLAHEQHHAKHGDGGGGGGGHNFRDAEEIAARAVERMVLQRAMEGGYDGGAQPTPGAGAVPQSGQGGSATAVAGPAGKVESTDGTAKAATARGYDALRARGLSHDEVVLFLARQVIDTIETGGATKLERHGDKTRAL